MFKIDLLKGRGVPIRSRPAGLIMAVVTTVVPIVVTMFIAGFYLRNDVSLSIIKRQIAGYTAKIGQLSEGVALTSSLERQRADYEKRLAETNWVIGRHRQWSPVLGELVSKMPESVVLTSVEIKRSSVKRSVPKKDSPGTMIEKPVPITTLSMSLCGDPQSDCDKVVRDFRDQLRSSELLGPQLENILVSQELTVLGGRDVVSYAIDCVFKPNL